MTLPNDTLSIEIKDSIFDISVEGKGQKGDTGATGLQGVPGIVNIIQDSVASLLPQETHLITHASDPNFKRIIEVLSQYTNSTQLDFLNSTAVNYDFDPEDILFLNDAELSIDFGAEGMVAYYIFDNDYTDVLDPDDFPGHTSHDATSVDTTITQDGIVGYAVTFNGISSYLDIPNHSDFYIVDPTTNSIGFEFWINTTATDGDIIGLWNEDDNRRSWRIYLQGGVLKFDLSVDGINVISSSIGYGFNDGNNHQVGIYLDNYYGGFYYLAYKDGSQIGIPGLTPSFSYPLFQNTIDPIRIGALGGTPSNFFNGRISELSFYRNYDLSQPQGMQSNIFQVHYFKTTLGQHLGFYDTSVHNFKTNSLGRIDTSSWLGITGTGFQANIYGNYVISVLFSMDAGTTWKMWDGLAWQTVSETTQGTPIQGVPQDKTIWDLIFVPGTLDIIIQLQTLDTLNTPYIASFNFIALLPGFIPVFNYINSIFVNDTQTLLQNNTSQINGEQTFYNVKTNILLP